MSGPFISSTGRRRGGHRRLWTVLGAIGLVLAVLAAAFGILWLLGKDEVPARTTIGGIPVGGLSEEAARARVAVAGAARAQRAIRLVGPGGTAETTGAALGATPNVDEAVEASDRAGCARAHLETHRDRPRPRDPPHLRAWPGADGGACQRSRPAVRRPAAQRRPAGQRHRRPRGHRCARNRGRPPRPAPGARDPAARGRAHARRRRPLRLHARGRGGSRTRRAAPRGPPGRQLPGASTRRSGHGGRASSSARCPSPARLPCVSIPTASRLRSGRGSVASSAQRRTRASGRSASASS